MTATAKVIPMATEKAKQANVVKGESGEFTLKLEGVFFAKYNKDGVDKERRICSYLKILAQTRTGTGTGWGRLLEWRDNDNAMHKWAMPMNLLAGDSTDVASELLDSGLFIAPGKKSLVLEYIQCADTIARITCTDRTGWHGNAYITPDKNYGDDADTYVYQGALSNAAIKQAGTLEDWIANVSACAIGNSRAAFAMSAGFAGALVELANIESGGFQFTGESKDGKTTCVKMAASIFGVPDKYKRLWRNTANALESIATMHNDGLLILDELKMCPAKDAGEIAYALTNGQEKGRLNKTTALKAAKSWRLMYFSTGEISLPDHIKSAGLKVFAGQEVRHADIPSDAGTGYKVMDTIHDFDSLADFFRHLNTAMSKYHGTAGDKWLTEIAKDRQLIESVIHDSIATIKKELLTDNDNSQHDVVATRFALVAFAGELATRYGITGWAEGEATRAANRCFNDWLVGFGKGNREHAQILETVRAFIERNGSKFRDLEINTPLYEIPDMVGCYRTTSDGQGREYIVLASQFARVIESYSAKQALPVLRDAGWLNEPDSTGKSAIRETLPGIGRTRVYVINFNGTESDD